MRLPTLSRFRIALLSAVPVEAVNFWVIGYPGDTHSLSRISHYAAAALEWDILHLPGIIACDRILLLRENAVACSGVLLASGFLDTALLALLIMSGSRLARGALRRLSSPLRQAA